MLIKALNRNDSRVVTGQALEHRYESFSINEAWVNRDIETGKAISPMFQMTGAIYDQVVCDPWLGASPHEKTLPKGFKKRPMVLAFVRKPSPIHTPERFEEYARENFLMKTLHLLAQDYEGFVYFSWVNSATDEDFVAATLALDQREAPAVLLIHENQAFIVPAAVLNYHDLAAFIEGEYLALSTTLWPLARRLDMLRYVLKTVFRRLLDAYKAWHGETQPLDHG